MSNQPEQENQQSETITSQELREFMMDELEARKQLVAEISDEQLTEIVGGTIGKVYEQPKITWTPKTAVAVTPAKKTVTWAEQEKTVHEYTPTPPSSPESTPPSSPKNGWDAVRRLWITGCIGCLNPR
jgi:hypothetical protein